MNDIEKNFKEVADTPRNDFDARYEQIKDRLATREPKQQKKVLGWKKYVAVAASLVVIISAIVASVLLFKPEEPRYLMADIDITNSNQIEYEESISNIQLDILDLAEQSVNDYKLYKTKSEHNIVGGQVSFNGTSNNDFYQIKLEIYSNMVTFETITYEGFTSTYQLDGRTFYYKENGMEGPFSKISCYYAGDDFSLVVDYQGVAGDVWGLLNLIIKAN